MKPDCLMACMSVILVDRSLISSILRKAYGSLGSSEGL